MCYNWSTPPEGYVGYEHPIDALIYQIYDDLAMQLDTNCPSCGYDCMPLFEMLGEVDGVEGIKEVNHKKHEGNILHPTYWSWTTRATCPRCDRVWEFENQDY